MCPCLTSISLRTTQRGFTALMYAAEKGNFAAVKYLLEKGAAVEANNQVIDSTIEANVKVLT